MSNNKKIVFFIFIALAIFLSGCSLIKETPLIDTCGVKYDDVLVVTNRDSPDSIEISKYFIEKRNIKYQVFIDVGSKEVVNYDTYKTIENTILQYMNSNNISEKINYIVTTKGVPIRFDELSGCTSNCRKSIDSGMTNMGNKLTKKAGFPSYMVTRLTGYTVADAKKLVTPSPCNSLKGVFLIDRAMKTTSGYASYDEDILNARNYILSQGYPVIYNDTSKFIMNQKNLDGYYSWGSNDGNAPSDSSTWNLSFNPGSIGETFVSTSARTFEQAPVYGQSLIADLVHMGISGVSGYTDEPYLSATTGADMFDYYLRGNYLADSFYYASGRPTDWMLVVVGDPKLKIITKDTCVPPQTKCGALNTDLLTCIAGENNWQKTSCSQNNGPAICVMGKCENVLCTPGQLRCDSTGLISQICATNGTAWIKNDDCPYGCSMYNSKTQICWKCPSPGSQKECTGRDTFRTCDSNSKTWKSDTCTYGGCSATGVGTIGCKPGFWSNTNVIPKVTATGNFDNLAYASDNNYNTATTPTSYPSTLYFNVTKPVNAAYCLWRYKMVTDLRDFWGNDDCWANNNKNYMTYRVVFNSKGSTSIQCQTSTGSWMNIQWIMSPPPEMSANQFYDSEFVCEVI